jgi:hypothetical protein
MKPHQLMKIITRTLQLGTGLVIYISTLPFLLTWRLLLHLLLPFNTYKPALSHYQKHRAAFDALALMKPIINYRVGIISSVLLLIYVTLAFALVEKSLVRFIPWISAHIQKTQYKLENEEQWHSELVLHIAGFMLVCAPFFGTLGVGAELLYYARKAWVCERRLGGEEKDGQRGESGEVVSEMESEESGMCRVMASKKTESLLVVRQCDLQNETARYGCPGCNQQRGAGEQLGHVQDWREVHDSVPPPLVVDPAKRATETRFKSNPYTLAGVMAIWGRGNGRSDGDHGGRDVRRRNFEEGIEMCEGLGRT